MDMDYELQLTDLIDTKILQQIQDAFSNMTGIAALTTDAHEAEVAHWRLNMESQSLISAMLV